MKLVIVESPTKAKTLQKFLGDGYEVLSSKGHVIDLPKKNLGVDVDHDFTPEYAEVPGKTAVISALKKAASSAEEIFLAMDPDREGEAIAWHIGQIIGDGKTKRVTFHEITEEAVKQSFLEPREINQQLVDSQQMEIIAKDQAVGGFNIGINAGEVAGQTVMHCHVHLIPRRGGDVSNPRGGVRHIIPGKGNY